jgi:hypothetical protein
MPSAVHPHTPKLVAGIAIYTVRLHDTQAGIMFCQGLTTLYCVEFLANDSVPPSTILTRVTKKKRKIEPPLMTKPSDPAAVSEAYLHRIESKKS